jgi:DNA-binding MarR family transcriptional regulator
VHTPEPAKDGRQSILELTHLIAATQVFFHDMERVSASILAEHRLTPQERRLLMALRQGRRCTVPQLARRRQVSRQHVQATMNSLARRGWVAFLPNPAHRRSRLLELTGEAENRIREIMVREGEALKLLAAKLTPAEAKQAAAVLEKAADRLGEWIP